MNEAPDSHRNGAAPSSMFESSSERPWLALAEKSDAKVAREVSANARDAIREIAEFFYNDARESKWRSHVDAKVSPPSDIERRLLNNDHALLSDLVARIETREIDDPSSVGEILWALEMLDEHNEALRGRLATALYNLALTLRDDERASVRPLLWSAVRRYASIVEQRAAATLLEFLREQDDAETRQVALLGIQSIFFRQSPPGGFDALVARLHVLVDAYLRADIVVEATMRALAANAVVALSVLRPAESKRLAERVRALARPGIVALVDSKWRDMIAAREADATREALLGAVAALR